MQKARAFCLAFWATLLAGNVLQAQPKNATVELDWQRSAKAESCASAAAIQKRVETRLARAVFVAAGNADFALTARLDAPLKDEWSAELALFRQGRKLGERALHVRDRNCAALEAATVLTLSLMLDVQALQAATEQEPLPNTTPLPAVSSPVPSSKVYAGSPQPPHALRLITELSGVGGVGILPQVAWAGRLGLSLVPRGFVRLGLDATLWAPSSQREGLSGVSLSKFELGLRLCPLEIAYKWGYYAACAAVRTGHVSASAFGFTINRAHQGWDLSTALQSRLLVKGGGPFILVFGAELSVPVLNTDFYYTRPDGERVNLYQLPPLAGSVEIGIGLIFDS